MHFNKHINRHLMLYCGRIGLIVFICCLSSVVCRLPAQQTQIYKPSVSRILFVVDGSGSMKQQWNGKMKFETARMLLGKLIDSVEKKNPNVEFAVRVFGYQNPNTMRDCKDTKLLVPFAKNNAQKISDALGKITPQGMSPVAYSIQLGAKDFPADTHSLNSIILITDGEENCDGDPCKMSKELVNKRITLKPFIVGLNIDTAKYKKFQCMGTFFDTKDEASLYQTVGVIIKQTLNTTTAQINLLDKNTNPTVTNLPFTLYDHFSGKALYNFVHTMNDKGNPDTLFLDPVGVYDLELHTFPSVRKENIELTPGKHNIIAVDVPAGDLEVDCATTVASNDAQAVVRRKSDPKQILNVQNLNEEVKYLAGDYNLHILTTPDMYIDTTVVSFTTNISKVRNYGTLNMIVAEKALVSIYRDKKGILEMVDRFEVGNRTESKRFQPGEYWVVYKVKSSYDSETTKTQKFTIEEDRIVVVTL